MVKNIVFDMGRVLIEYSPEDYVRNYVSGDEDANCLLEAIFNAPDWIDNDRGSVTYDEYLARIKSRLPRHLYSAAEQLWEHWIDYIQPIPETNELAKVLKQKGYELYLLSNVSVRYREFRGKITSIPYFDGEFISADVLAIKPEREIYELFFKRFGLVPEECFFIDDNPDNIAAAKQLGMQGFRYQWNIDDLKYALRNAGINI